MNQQQKPNPIKHYLGVLSSKDAAILSSKAPHESRDEAVKDCLTLMDEFKAISWQETREQGSWNGTEITLIPGRLYSSTDRTLKYVVQVIEFNWMPKVIEVEKKVEVIVEKEVVREVEKEVIIEKEVVREVEKEVIVYRDPEPVIPDAPDLIIQVPSVQEIVLQKLAKKHKMEHPEHYDLQKKLLEHLRDELKAKRKLRGDDEDLD